MEAGRGDGGDLQAAGHDITFIHRNLQDFQSDVKMVWNGFLTPKKEFRSQVTLVLQNYAHISQAQGLIEED